MGYTNYLRQHRAFTDDEWKAITLDAQAVIAEARWAGIHTAGPTGDGHPELTDERIRFNGAGDDAYEGFELLKDPGERIHEEMVAAIRLPDTSPEYRLELGYAKGHQRDWQENRTYFSFCKTNRHDYDSVVKAVVACACSHAPDAVTVSWDGPFDEYLFGAHDGPNMSAAGLIDKAVPEWAPEIQRMLRASKEKTEHDKDEAPAPGPTPDIELALELPEPPSRRGPGSNQYQDKPPSPRSYSRDRR